MKKILVVGLLSFAFLSYGQRKELRQAEKLLDQSFYNEALNVLSQIESMIDGVDQKYQAHYYYIEGWALKGDSKFNESVASLKKAIEIDNKIKLNKYAEESSFLIEQVEADLVNSAVAALAFPIRTLPLAKSNILAAVTLLSAICAASIEPAA